MKRLKIAVCFFGHLRSYKECAPFFYKNFLKHHDCDLFMHTWTTLDHGTKTWHDLKKAKGLSDRNEIISSYGELKGIFIEEQKIEDLGVIRITKNYHEKERSMSIFGILSMFHSMIESMSMQDKYSKENNIKYDYVLFIRPDIWLKKKFEIKEIVDSLPDHKIQGGFFTLFNNSSNVVSGLEDMSATDLVFFAKPETMLSIMSNLDKIKEKLKPNTVITHAPEYIFINMVKESGFVPYCINFPMLKNWDIRRVSESIKLKKRIISLRIGKNSFHIHFFPKSMNSIFGITINIFGVFSVNFSVGDPN